MIDPAEDPIEAIFIACLERAPAAREAYLEQACGRDNGLRARVEALLRAHERADDVLPDSPPSAAGDGREQIGRYRLIRLVGRGGQGAVHLAEDTQLGRRVALKVLSPGLRLDRRLLERFRREAEATARLDHPAICAVHDAGVDRGVSYIAMRYVEGETLARRIERVTASEGTASAVHEFVRVIEQAAGAVHTAHEAGIIHRDIKPGNIMVTPGGDPVVLDFGVARDEQSNVSLTLSGDVFGTPAYMAPEQIEPEFGRADRRTDVYGLGATLYECVTLQRPFEAPTREALYREILDHEPPDPRRRNPEISRDLAIVLETALAKEQDRRYQTAADLAEDLRRVREHEPILACRAGPVLRYRRWARRNPAVALASTSLLLLLVGALAITGVLLGRTRTSLAESRRLADMRTLDHLERRAAEDLWPVLPEAVPKMNAWIAEAEAFYGRLKVHQKHLDSLDPGSERDRVARFVTDLEAFSVTIETIRERREDALTITARTIDEYREEWDAAVVAITDRDRNPQYRGLRMTPQVGLVPIGRDPDSGLYEFAHPQTGKVPIRDPETGRLIINEQTGLVFVLIPGGSALMLESEPGYAGSTHRLWLHPFFISKYEMTQGQWLRASGENPSRWSPGSDAYGDITLLHPVEWVSWDQCAGVMQRFGLRLPTFAQWEYAARGGTRTVWWTGEDAESLQGAVNVADQAAARAGADWYRAEAWPDIDDGYVEHAPVGTYRANPFGLHEVGGNVREFVGDAMSDHWLSDVPRRGDGERLARSDTGHRSACGGGFYDSRKGVQSTSRGSNLSSRSDFSTGLRPARALDSWTWDGRFRVIPKDHDGFGRSLAGLGDLDGDGGADVVVGAPFDDDCYHDAGAVWVLFLSPDGTVIKHGKISATFGEFTGKLAIGLHFGWSLTTLGDLDRDGTVEIGVGAPRDDGDSLDQHLNTGAVWILSLDREGRVASHHKISPRTDGPPVSRNQRFGYSVAALGDLDGDGTSDLAVGAPGGSGRDAGAVWILLLNDDETVKSYRMITPDQEWFPDGLEPTRFGERVSGAGDCNGDGVVDLLVSDSDLRQTRWLLFLNRDGTVSGHREISIGQAALPLDRGQVLGRAEHVDLLNWCFDRTHGGGFMSLFLDDDGALLGQRMIHGTRGGFTGRLDDNDHFGGSVASIGDLDGDGVMDLVVGASGDDDGGPDRGAAWVLFMNRDWTVRAHQKISATEGGPADRLIEVP